MLGVRHRETVHRNKQELIAAETERETEERRVAQNKLRNTAFGVNKTSTKRNRNRGRAWLSNRALEERKVDPIKKITKAREQCADAACATVQATIGAEEGEGKGSKGSSLCCRAFCTHVKVVRDKPQCFCCAISRIATIASGGRPECNARALPYSGSKAAGLNTKAHTRTDTEAQCKKTSQ